MMLYIHSLTWVLLTCPKPVAAFSPVGGNRFCASLLLTKKLGSSFYAVNGELNVALFNPSEGYFETSFTVPVRHHDTD